MNTQHILCIGEVLWDVLPSGMFLGGAPLNVACDLHQLGRHVTIVSRVGSDDPGRRAIQSMEARGMSAAMVQIDTSLPTGIVQVEIGPGDAPHFTINQPSAWDAIEPPDLSKDEPPEIVVFGSLAQRAAASRSTIGALCARARTTIFDVNLRPPFDDREIVRRSLHETTILKLNRNEVVRISEWFGLPASEQEFCQAVAKAFGCTTVCITRDADGAAVWHEGRWSEHAGYRIDVKDTVGAGDAFLAGFIARYLEGGDWAEVLEFANLLGAFVASSNGATPVFTEADLRAFKASVARR
jgi:fructokinase